MKRSFLLVVVALSLVVAGCQTPSRIQANSAKRDYLACRQFQANPRFAQIIQTPVGEEFFRKVCGFEKWEVE